MKQYKCILKPPCLLKEVIRKIHRVWLHLVKIPECKRICNDRMHRSMSTCTWAGDGRRDSKGWGMRKFWGMMEMFYIFLSSFWTYIFIPFLYRILSSWNTLLQKIFLQCTTENESFSTLLKPATYMLLWMVKSKRK